MEMIFFFTQVLQLQNVLIFLSQLSFPSSFFSLPVSWLNILVYPFPSKLSWGKHVLIFNIGMRLFQYADMPRSKVITPNSPNCHVYLYFHPWMSY